MEDKIDKLSRTIEEKDKWMSKGTWHWELRLKIQHGKDSETLTSKNLNLRISSWAECFPPVFGLRKVWSKLTQRIILNFWITKLYKIIMIDINKARIILSQKLIHRLRAIECKKSPRKDT